MSRSRKRKLARHPLLSHARHSRARSVAPAVAGAVCAALSPGWVLAQEAGALEEVVVTAQKRSESLQDVPLSIQAIGTQRLEELSVKSFDDYVRFLPSVTFQTLAPGFASVYMRGIASGENSNHSGPLPSVGIYLDEQPITTIQGALDVHIYDIARVEALAGPQGTLYGASSQAGTIRIITNKPDSEAFDAGFSLEGNMVSKGDLGYLAEGFVNLPVGERAAIRLVGFAKRDAGFIDNVPGTRTYPVSGVTINNNALVEEDYNAVDTYGARAALRIDLSDNWTITPAIMAQQTKAGGSFSYNPALGDMRVSRFLPESLEDRWAQLALTVEGKIANLNVVYAGAYLKRDADTLADYSDYSFFYDVNYGSGAYIYDNAGNVIEPTQGTIGKDGYKRQSHELRFSTAGEGRVRAVGGLFYQRQVHDILQNYYIRNFSDFFAVTGYPDTIWLTNQQRVDRDYAAFGEVTFDATEKLSLTAGVRYFESRNSLIGFFGYGGNFSSRTGEAACFTPVGVGRGINGGPCINLDKEVEEDGWTPRVNATYKLDDDKMVYLTYSEGFRPGGINRRGTLPPFNADFLTNYEFGWKTTWAANTLRFNGALFLLKWDDIQFSYLGLNGLTEIRNAGNAEVRGLEVDLSWAASDNLTITGGFALTDTELTSDYCIDASSCPPANAPAGTQLPVTPKFKGNLTARYGFPLGGMDGHVQLAAVYQGSNWADLQTADRLPLGQLAAYTTADLAIGASADNYEYEFFIQNLFDKRGEVTFTTQCAINGFAGNTLCGNQPYTIPNRPRLIGFKYTQRF
jgi:outer membrane receptor protein involved in Fe transport